MNKCPHDTHWTTVFGTCMACQLEAAEADRDAARAEAATLRERVATLERVAKGLVQVTEHCLACIDSHQVYDKLSVGPIVAALADAAKVLGDQAAS